MLVCVNALCSRIRLIFSTGMKEKREEKTGENCNQKGFACEENNLLKMKLNEMK